MASAKRRTGRPVKPPLAGQRATLSLLVRPEIKAEVEQRAKASGTTLAAAAELMLEKCTIYDEMIAVSRRSLAEIEAGYIEDALRRAGYTPIRHVDKDGTAWKLWAEPNFPGIARSGFIADDDAPETPSDPNAPEGGAR
jgi:hypothetical protein